MTITQHRVTADVTKARKLRQQLVLDRLDYEREVVRLTALISQSELSRQLKVSQPTINETVKKAKRQTPVKPGFAGATPYEVAQRFAVGEIARADLIEQLATWDYTPSPQTDGYDSLIVDPPGTFEEVSRALSDGLIDDATYDAILDRSEELSR
jgi:hypothetical protein